MRVSRLTSLSAFAGTWGQHDTRGLAIAASGAGTLGLPDFAACSTCDEANAPTNTISFVLSSTSPTSASGAVTKSTDSQTQGPDGNPVNAVWVPGAPVELTVQAAPSGRVIQLTIGGQDFGDFCDDVAQLAGECGA